MFCCTQGGIRKTCVSLPIERAPAMKMFSWFSGRSRRRIQVAIPVCAEVQALEGRQYLSHQPVLPISVELEDQQASGTDYARNQRGRNVQLELETQTIVTSDLDPIVGDFPWVAEASAGLSGTVNGRVSIAQTSTRVGVETRLARDGEGSLHEAYANVYVQLTGVYDLSLTADVQIVGDHESLETGDAETIDAMASNILHIFGSGTLYLNVTVWTSVEIIDEPNASFVITDASSGVYIRGMRMTIDVTQVASITNDQADFENDEYAFAWFEGVAWGTSGSFSTGSSVNSTDAVGSLLLDRDDLFAYNLVYANGRTYVEGDGYSFVQDGDVIDDSFVSPSFKPYRYGNSQGFAASLNSAPWEGYVTDKLWTIDAAWMQIFWW